LFVDKRYRLKGAGVNAGAAGNTAFSDVTFHIIFDYQHADGAHVNAGLAAGAPERVNFYSHNMSSSAQAGLVESFDQRFHLLLQIAGEHLGLVDPMREKHLDDLR
jgi:hypothetical protein